MITLIRIENITKSYSSSIDGRVLKGISLDFKETGFVSILGKSGSGKSTLLNIIGGLDKGKGTIYYDDKKITHYDSKVIDLYRNQNIGYIFQNYLLLPDLTVYENIDVALSLSGINNEEEKRKRIDQCLKAVGLERFKRRVCSALSGGQQQRVAIARALAKDSKVLICDEPTGNLDSVNTIEIVKLLKSISETKLVIMVTHNEELAKNFSDRIIHLVDGEIVSDKSNEGKGVTSTKNEIVKSTFSNEELKSKNILLNSYIDDSINEEIKLTIIHHNGKIKINVESSHQIMDEDIVIVDKVEEQIQEPIKLSFNKDFDNKKKKTNIFKRLFMSLKRVSTPKKNKKGMKGVFIIFGIVISCFIYLASNVNLIYSSEDNQRKSEDLYFDNQITLTHNPEYNNPINVLYRTKLFDFINDDSGVSGVKPIQAFASIYDFHKVNGLFDLNETFLSDESKINIVEYDMYANDFNKIHIGRLAKEQDEVNVTIGYLEDFLNYYRVNNKNIKDEVILDSWFAFGYGSRDYKVVGVIKSDINAIVCNNKNYVEFSDNYNKSDLNNVLSYAMKISKTMLVEDYLKENNLEELNTLVFPDPAPQFSKYQSNVYMSTKLYSALYDYMDNLKKIHFVGVFPSDEYLMLFATEEDREIALTAGLNDTMAVGFSSVNSIFNFRDIEELKDNSKSIVFLNGNTFDSIKHGDVIVSKTYYDFITKRYPVVYSCTIVGYFENDGGQLFDIYCSSRTYDILSIPFSTYIRVNLDLFVVDDFSKAEDYFFVNGFLVEKTNDYYLDKTYELIKRIFIIVIIAIAIVVSLFMFLTNRSKMIKNIYTIGVFRALGVAKKNIYRVFFLDSLSITSTTMGFSYICTYLFLLLMHHIYRFPLYNFVNFIIGLGVIFVVNVVSSMIPLITLLKKTPREITIKYDI